MKFELTILGNGSAIPTLSQKPSAQILNHNEKLFLIDCGEGTQIQIRKYKIKFQRISAIFISHLHGDHYFGLIGILNTMQLLGRNKPLTIVCPEKLKTIIDIQMEGMQRNLSFSINYVFLNFTNGQKVFENKDIEVHTILLKHKIPCCGYIFKEKNKKRKINTENTSKYKVPVFYFNKLKEGHNYIDDEGKIIENKILTYDPPPKHSYVYCTDTAYNELIIENLKKIFVEDDRNIDLLYHESTFIEKDKENAKKTLHSTAKQAAKVALNLKVNKLLLGHFSNRYTDLNLFLKEAQSIFPNTFLSEEGKTYKIS